MGTVGRDVAEWINGARADGSHDGPRRARPRAARGDGPDDRLGRRRAHRPAAARHPRGWADSQRSIGDAMHHAKPYGVDVSSGIEDRPGVKNPALMRAFANAVHSAGV